MPALHIYLLEDFRLTLDDKPIMSVDSPRLQAFLAYLILHRQAPQQRSHIAFTFWPDTTEANARNNLRQLLFDFRRALPIAKHFINVQSATLQWRANSLFTLDVDDFERSLDEADQQQEPMRAGLALKRAIEVYSGDLLHHCYDEWIALERERLSQRFISALERLVELEENQQEWDKAIEHCHRLLRHDPLHEATYRHLMHLMALKGDRASALRTYHTLTTVLHRELDVDPSPETSKEYERLLNPAAPRVKTRPTFPVTAPFVGRSPEWAQLQWAWNKALEGPSHLIVLEGEAGMGKTRLAEEFVQWAQRRGIATAGARCYAAEGAPAFAPVITWLRARPLPGLDGIRLAEVARLLPEIRTRYPDLEVRPLTEAWERQHLFESLAHAILDGVPSILLLLDDLQWCDPDTLAWLEFLLRFNAPTRLLLLTTLRPEELEPETAISSLLYTLTRDGQLTRIELAPLDGHDTLMLANSLAKQPLDTVAAERLYQQTEGNPLFIVETVCAELTDSQPTPSTPSSANLPPKMQSVLLRRLEQLSPVTRELLNVAAIIGRDFSFNVLAKASDLNEDHIVQAIDELWRRRIVREHGTDSYDFSHDKFRQVALSSLSRVRRKQLHRRVAQALESIHTKDLNFASAKIAAHYEQGGMVDRAIEFYQRAAEAARAIYANQEAIEHYEHALVLLSAERDVRAVRLYEDLGEVLDWIGEPVRARNAYEQSLLRSESGSVLEQARLYCKISGTFETRHQHAEAHRALDTADTLLSQARDEHEPAWCHEWLEIRLQRMERHYMLAQWQEVEQLAQEAQPLLERMGSPAQRIDFLNCLVRIAFRRDRYKVSDESLARRETVLSIAEATHAPSQVASARFGYGFALLWHGDLYPAETQFRPALELAEQIGNLHLQVLCLTYLTIACRRQGKLAEVDALALRSHLTAQKDKTLCYIGAAKATLAWIAWHKRNIRKAHNLGLEALELMNSETAYPFQWVALFLLLAIALNRGETSKMTEYARRLLAPVQMRLPLELETALQNALDTSPQAARKQLAGAIQLAKQGGYL